MSVLFLPFATIVGESRFNPFNIWYNYQELRMEAIDRAKEEAQEEAEQMKNGVSPDGAGPPPGQGGSGSTDDPKGQSPASSKNSLDAGSGSKKSLDVRTKTPPLEGSTDGSGAGVGASRNGQRSAARTATPPPEETEAENGTPPKGKGNGSNGSGNGSNAAPPKGKGNGSNAAPPKGAAPGEDEPEGVSGKEKPKRRRRRKNTAKRTVPGRRNSGNLTDGDHLTDGEGGFTSGGEGLEPPDYPSLSIAAQGSPSKAVDGHAGDGNGDSNGDSWGGVPSGGGEQGPPLPSVPPLKVWQEQQNEALPEDGKAALLDRSWEEKVHTQRAPGAAGQQRLPRMAAQPVEQPQAEARNWWDNLIRIEPMTDLLGHGDERALSTDAALGFTSPADHRDPTPPGGGGGVA